MGTEYRNGGDIRSTIEQNVRFAIPMPLDPSGTNDEVERTILRFCFASFAIVQRSQQVLIP